MLGKELLNTPHNAFSIWTTYDVTESGRSAAARTSSDAVFGNADNTTQVPSYWRFDLMTSYKVTNNIDRAAQHLQPDERILLRAGLQQLGGPGAGRSAALTLRGRW